MFLKFLLSNVSLKHVPDRQIHIFSSHIRDYLPDLIANDSLAFFKVSKQAFPNRPVALVLSFPSPHGPEDCAPQYADDIHDNQLHR